MTATILLLAFLPLSLVGSRLAMRRDAPDDEGADFRPVADEAALDALFVRSQEEPVTLYLHDPYCPISARAFRRLDAGGGEIHVVDVSVQHALNREIARRTGIRHESPQAFVLSGGRAVWNASHGDIDAEAIARARAALDG